MDFVDKKLVKKIKSGDVEAFSELIDIYKDKIYYLAFKMLGNKQEAEDISQETFLRVYTNIDNYDLNYKFSTWIYKIATNLCIDRIRKKKADYSLDDYINDDEGLDWYSKIPNEQISPEDEVIYKEQRNLIRSSISKLPPKYKAIMTLRYVHDLSVQEISDIVNLPNSTIKTRLFRGREYLRKSLIVSDNHIERTGQYELQ